MDSSVTLRIVDEIATREEVDPEDLTPRLYDVIDPDALETLFETPGSPIEGTVEFRYSGYDVAVHSDGRLEISTAAEHDTAAR